MARIYRTRLDTEDAAEVPAVSVIYSGSQGDAAKARRQLMETHGVKMKDVEIEELDVPTDKRGLIDWLNANA